MSATTIKTTITGGEIRVVSPYNTDFVARARKLRGKWESNAWVFPESIKDHVLDAVREEYGVDGTTDYPTCTLWFTKFTSHASAAPVEYAGRVIARAFGRDSGAKLGDDIFLISGKATSGGSVKNWRTVVEDATFEIHNVPVAVLEWQYIKDEIAAGTCIVKGLPEPETPADGNSARADLLAKLEEAVHAVFAYNEAALDQEAKIAFTEAATKLIESLK